MQKNTAHSSYPITANRSWLWMVLVGFLWLQFAGVVHKHSHTDMRDKVSSLEQILPQHSHDNNSDCRLLDLQCSGLALGFNAIVIAAPPLTFVFQAKHFSSFYQTAAGNYQARAPPKTSI